MLEMLQNLEPDVIKGLGSQADENSRKKVKIYSFYNNYLKKNKVSLVCNIKQDTLKIIFFVH